MSQEQDVAAAAKATGVPFGLLWGIFGAESSWGKGGSNWFGLTAVPRTSSFAGDAKRSGETLHRLYYQQGSWEGALRAYSGGSYGYEHAHQLGQENRQHFVEIIPGESKIPLVGSLGKALQGGGEAGGKALKKATTGWVGELLEGAAPLVIKGVLLLAGAVLVVYGIMVAVRPRESAFSLPRMPMPVPV